MNRLSPEEFQEANKIPLVLLLEDIRSMSNVGSLFRTADAFRLEHIYLCGITGCPPHKEIRKTALGAEETVAWTKYESAIDCLTQLKEKGYKTLALEQAETSTKPADLDIKEPCVLILGSEVDGVSQEIMDRCDSVVEIEQFGSKHSLNVSVAGGIAIYEISNQLISNLDLK